MSGNGGCGERLRQDVRSGAVYCSAVCRSRQWCRNRRLRKRVAAELSGVGRAECPECGATWAAEADRRWNAVYCPRRCVTRARKETFGERSQRPHREHIRIPTPSKKRSMTVIRCDRHIFGPTLGREASRLSPRPLGRAPVRGGWDPDEGHLLCISTRRWAESAACPANLLSATGSVQRFHCTPVRLRHWPGISPTRPRLPPPL